MKYGLIRKGFVLLTILILILISLNPIIMGTVKNIDKTRSIKNADLPNNFTNFKILETLDDPTWQWAVGAGGTGWDRGHSICIDANGNTYITGCFCGNASFGSIILTGSPGYGNRDVFVAKLDSNGVWQWAVGAGGTGWDWGTGICLDSNSNIYLTGYFSGNVSFGSNVLTSSGNYDIFVTKLDSNGVWQWAVGAGGTGPDEGKGICADSTGSIYITGYFFGTASFGTIMLSGNGGQDIFVAKLDGSGGWGWVVNAGGLFGDEGRGICVDTSGNVYFTGYFSGNEAWFGSTVIGTNGYDDVFVAKLNSNGGWQWAVGAGGSSWNDVGYGICGDPSGNIFIIGGFTDTASFGSTTLIGNSADVFVAKLDSNGVWQWAVGAGGTQSDVGQGICADSTGSIYIIGCFSGTASFGTIMLSGNGGQDIFVAKLDSNGVWQWAVGAGGSSWDDVGYGICRDPSGSLCLTGIFGATASFGSVILTSSGYWDIFVAKLSNVGMESWEISWNYPTSDNEFEIEMYEKYEIVLNVKNIGSEEQVFDYGLNRPSYICYNVFDFEISPYWYLAEQYICLLDGSRYYFGEIKTDNIGSSQTRIYTFEIYNNWNWLPSTDIISILSLQLLSTFSGYKTGTDILSFLMTITQLNFATVPQIKYNYCGLADSNIFPGYVKVWTTQTKSHALMGSILNMVLAGFDTSLGVVSALTGLGLVVSLIAWIGEGAIIAASQDLYNQAVDPDGNYTEIVNPNPLYYPALENFSDINYTIAELSLNVPCISEACTKSYVKYLGAQEAGAMKWAIIQLASTKYYMQQLSNTSHELFLLYENHFPEFPPFTAEDIADIRDYLNQNGLPDIEKDILYYHGFNNTVIERILQVLLDIDDNYYYNLSDNFPENFHNLSVAYELSLEDYPDPPGRTLFIELDTYPDTMNITNPPDSIYCYVEFENISNLTGYEINSALLNNEINPVYISQYPGDYDEDGISDFTIVFNGQQVANILTEGDQLLSLFGEVTLPTNEKVNYSGSYLSKILGTSPETPATPTGKSSYFARIPYNCSTMTIDGENSDVYFKFDWGDGNISKWLGPFNSGETVYAEYIWENIGEYEIKAKAMDVWGLESDWSEPFVVNITEIDGHVSFFFGTIHSVRSYEENIMFKAKRLLYFRFKPLWLTFFSHDEDIILTEKLIGGIIEGNSIYIIGLFQSALLDNSVSVKHNHRLFFSQNGMHIS